MDWPTFESQLWEFFLGAAKTSTVVGLLGLVLFVTFFWLLWKAQKSESRIKFGDLFLDYKTGRMSVRYTGELVALFGSTFGFLFVLSSEMSESIKLYAFMFWSLLWAARSLLGGLISARFGGSPSRQQSDDEDDPPPALQASATVRLEGAGAAPKVSTSTTALPASESRPARRPRGKYD